MEYALLVHPALGHQEMEVGVEIYPVPEGLDGGDDAGDDRAEEAVLPLEPAFILRQELGQFRAREYGKLSNLPS